MGPFISEATNTLKCSKKKKPTDITKDQGHHTPVVQKAYATE